MTARCGGITREGSMKRLMMMAGMVLVASTTAQASINKPLKDLPKDAWTIATFWTEPIRQVAAQARRFDPLSGLWFGLLEGSVKSVERTAGLFWSQDDDSSQGSSSRKALLRYSF